MNISSKFSPTPEEHMEWLAEALEKFKKANLKLQVKEHDIASVM
jgi:HEPN domain-containing protein